MNWEVVMGLEVHVELSTKSKIFCSCSTEFGGAPNTHCCPICMGMPGTLPVLNEAALAYAVKAGVALNCDINRYNKFDRKNYFYPDLPKAYQISQLYLPLCQNGRVEVVTQSGKKAAVRIHEIHMEEDAGKLIHSPFGDATYPDYNRCGVPLIEIVSEPDLRSAEEVMAYLEHVKQALEYIGVSDCKMQEGSLRADVNLSVRPAGSDTFGTRTEMKNMNSFKAIERAIAAEAKRQIEVLESGGEVVQETRRWDDDKGKSFAMRGKENAHDYRYFPEPDIPPISLTDERVEAIRASLPEMPRERFKRYTEQYGLPEYDADVLIASRNVSDYFDAAVSAFPKYKAVSNFMMRDFMRLLNEAGGDISACKASPKALAALLKQVEDGKINLDSARNVFEEIFASGGDPEAVIQQKGLVQISDASEIAGLIKEAIANNPNVVADYKAGKEKALTFFVGQVMKATKGKANPQIVNQIVKEELGK